MMPIVPRTPAVGALLVTGALVTACASNQKQLTAPQQAAAQAEDQAQKAQEEAQKARESANKAQNHLAGAEQANEEARKAEIAADQKAQQASRDADVAEGRAGQAVPPQPAAPPSGGAAEKQGGATVGPHQGHDSTGKVVVITASFLFTTNSAELLPSAKPKLDEIADALQAQPQSSHVKVEGHTDSTGSPQTNDALSQKRAQAVADYLESKGVASDRITAQGMGKQDPVSHAHDAEGRALNRRVDIMIEPAEGPGKTNAPEPQAPPQQAPPQP
jgi:outer membrane protein OmpA-like peptidoglycan-associated protein